MLHLKAQSSKYTWQQCLKQYTNLDKRTYRFGRDMGYVVFFIFPDGTTEEHPIELYTPVTDTWFHPSYLYY
ncbi:MAG: hypothetical protein ACYC27_04605 [Armatimonadota bacterium]